MANLPSRTTILPGTQLTIPSMSSSGSASPADASKTSVMGTIAKAGIEAIGSIFGAKKQSSTAKSVGAMQIKATEQAAKLEDDAAQRQLEWLREQDALDRRDAEILRRQNYDLSEASSRDSWAMSEADRRMLWENNEANRKIDWSKYITRETNLAPYRGIGKSAGYTLANLVGLSPSSLAMPDPKTTNPYVGTTYTPAPAPTTVPYVPLPTETRIPAQTTNSVPASASQAAAATLPSAPTAATTTAQNATVPLSAVGAAVMKPSLVLMQAPDGSQQSVPASAVPYFQAKGARLA